MQGAGLRGAGCINKKTDGQAGVSHRLVETEV